MKFEPPIELVLRQPDNLSLIVKAGSYDKDGLIKASVQVWNGTILYGSTLVLDDEAARTAYSEKASQKAHIEAQFIERGLLTLHPEIASRIALGSPLATDESEQTQISEWPKPPTEEAYYGLVGEIVHAIEPHTEADPVAVLVQTLVAFGNCINRNAYFAAENDYHYMNLFAVMVGTTSKGRKGTSWSRVRNLFSHVDEDWTKNRVQSGLSSGEGLIWAVRDAIRKQEAVREKGKIVDYREAMIDEGVGDKRLLALESEFAMTLRVTSRDGNTLSALIRQAWDSGNLRILTKNSPAQSTDAHISIIGHITKNELVKYLGTTEAANGFANRFLWVCVRRSKVLPEGGGEFGLSYLTHQLHEAIRFARSAQEMKRDSKARALWFEIYEEMSEGKPGLLGAAIGRAEAQVMRLACLYALLDSSDIVRLEHLRGALALWYYVEDSARYIFGDSLGDPLADELLGALKASPTGMTRTEIREHFQRHKTSKEITETLQSLMESGMVYCERRPRSDGKPGKPTEVWLTRE